MRDLNGFKLYRCHKEVHAVKIAEIHPGRADGGGPGATLLGEATGARAEDVALISVSDEWMAKHQPEPGGYFVAYEDGYTSYSPAQAFEAGYSRV